MDTDYTRNCVVASVQGGPRYLAESTERTEQVAVGGGVDLRLALLAADSCSSTNTASHLGPSHTVWCRRRRRPQSLLGMCQRDWEENQSCWYLTREVGLFVVGEVVEDSLSWE